MSLYKELKARVEAKYAINVVPDSNLQTWLMELCWLIEEKLANQPEVIDVTEMGEPPAYQRLTKIAEESCDCTLERKCRPCRARSLTIELHEILRSYE